MNEQQLSLRWCQLQIDLAPYKKIHLLEYPASTIRGGLGYALKENAEHSALYQLLYEEQEGIQLESGYMAYTRPMIIRTRRNLVKTIHKDDSYRFEMILFGDVIEHYRAIITALEQFGQVGIGKDKDRFSVKRVVTKSPGISNMIYDDGEWVGTAKGTSWEAVAPFFASYPTKVKIDFKTPVKLKVNGDYQSSIAFEHFIENLSRRVQSMLYYHQSAQMLDTSKISHYKDQALAAKTYYDKFTAVSYDRFSTRQGRKIALEGIEGTMIMEGEAIAALFPLLYIGQFTHLGKQALFGLGEYELTVYQ